MKPTRLLRLLVTLRLLRRTCAGCLRYARAYACDASFHHAATMRADIADLESHTRRMLRRLILTH